MLSASSPCRRSSSLCLGRARTISGHGRVSKQCAYPARCALGRTVYEAVCTSKNIEHNTPIVDQNPSCLIAIQCPLRLLAEDQPTFDIAELLPARVPFPRQKMVPRETVYLSPESITRRREHTFNLPHALNLSPVHQFVASISACLSERGVASVMPNDMMPKRS